MRVIDRLDYRFEIVDLEPPYGDYERYMLRILDPLDRVIAEKKAFSEYYIRQYITKLMEI